MDSAYLVLVGAAFGELALWVVRWWVSVGVRLVADATRWFNVENVRGTLRAGWDTSSQGAPHVRSVTGWKGTDHQTDDVQVD